MHVMRTSHLRALSLVALNLPHAASLGVFSMHTRRLSRCSIRRHAEGATGADGAEAGTPPGRNKSYEKPLESLTLEEIEALPSLDDLAAAAGATGTVATTRSSGTGTGPLYCGDFSERSVYAARFPNKLGLGFGFLVWRRIR